MSTSTFTRVVIPTTLVALMFLLILAVRTTDAGSPEGPDDMEKLSEARDTLQIITDAVVAFANEEKRLPTRLEQLTPRYLVQVPLDPYGRRYVLTSNGSLGAFVTYLGKDGKPKGYVERDIDHGIYIQSEGGKFSIAKD